MVSEFELSLSIRLFIKSLLRLILCLENKSDNFEFIIFITNKTEDTKVHEETFIKDIEINLPEDKTPEPFTQISNFSDKIFLNQKLYENGVKTFLAIN